MTLIEFPPCAGRKAEFLAFVKRGAEVAPASLPGLYDRARFLLELRDGSTLIGTAALKVPNPNYRNTCFCKAGVESLAAGFDLELGWIVVDPLHEGNGYSSRLLDRALQLVGQQKFYATSKNPKIQGALGRRGFVLQGTTYLSGQDANAPPVALYTFTPM